MTHEPRPAREALDRLPPSPICLGGERLRARHYLGVLESALRLDHWRHAERRELIRRWKLWKLRAEGHDPYFDEYGTFGRMPGAPPPTVTDITMKRWKDRARSRKGR
jgi:hypothetical protein